MTIVYLEKRLKKLKDQLVCLINSGAGGGGHVYPYATFSDFPATGVSGFLYLDRSGGVLYYWHETQYYVIG